MTSPRCHGFSVIRWCTQRRWESASLIRIWRLRVWRIFSLGGHRNVEKAGDHHHAEEGVGKVLQHQFLPRHCEWVELS